VIEVSIISYCWGPTRQQYAPCTFPLRKTAFYDLLQQSYETHGIEKIGFATENNGSYRKGQIFRHDAKKLYRSTRIKIINGVIYVDDTALVFASRNEMIKALPLAQKLFSRFY
jgi:hypothetical protein